MRHCKQTVFLILLMLVLLLPLASAEGRTFITVDGWQLLFSTLAQGFR